MIKNDTWQWKHRATAPLSETGYEHMIDSLNIIPVEDFKALSDAEQVPYVREVIKRIREVNIYPIHYYTDEGVYNEIRKSIMHDVEFVGDSLRHHGRAGSTLLDFLFPNLHLVEAGNSVNNSLYSRFYDDDKLAKCITRHMKNYTFTSMRTPFFMYGRYFWNTATNFNAMRAKAIYRRFCKPGDVVYDFSAGFGGRMLGALSNSAMNLTYIGCEPNSDTYYNLGKLGQYVEDVTGKADTYALHKIGSEDLRLEANSVDFAFSCPPYYGLERYCDEDTQSIVRFPVYRDWLKGYVVPTMRNVYDALKPGGLFGYVIHNVWYRNKKYMLSRDWHGLATRVGFTPVNTYPIQTMARKDPNDVETLYLFRKEG